jgi:hypothetical protein
MGGAEIRFSASPSYIETRADLRKDNYKVTSIQATVLATGYENFPRWNIGT